MAEGLREVAEQLTRLASTSSASRPTSLTKATARSNTARGPVDLPRQGQRLREPERAEQEGALPPGHPVGAPGGAVAVTRPRSSVSPVRDASMVRIIRGSSAGRKPTMAIMRVEASSSF